MGIFWALLTLAGVHLLAVASPGPAFVSVLQTSVRNPRRITLLHVLGLGLAATLWAAAAVLGMEALLARAAWLYRAMELGGGLYLAWIGVQAWLHAKEPMAEPAGSVAGQAGQTPAAMTGWQALRRGFSTNIANPKVMVFFASIFSAVLKPSLPMWVRLVAVGVIFVDETMWNGGLSLLLSTARAQAAYTRAKAGIDRTAGTVMVGFGLRLVWGARRAV